MDAITITINGTSYNLKDATARELIAALQTAVANKVDKVTGKGLSSNDYTTEEKNKLSGLSNYDDTEIRGLISTKADASSLASYFNAAGYNSVSRKIELKHGSNVLAEIDATAFIKDGMVNDVSISGGYLVITFNTDSGKSPISIPLSDIFNPDSYYTKSATDSLLSAKQNTISDLSTIRSGAAAGATALQPSDTVNSLSSSSTTAPLSANQGKVLNDEIALVGNNAGAYFLTKELTQGISSNYGISGDFKVGDVLELSAIGTAGIAENGIKVRNSDNDNLTSLSINDAVVTITLAKNSTEIRFLVSISNTLSSGEVIYRVIRKSSAKDKNHSLAYANGLFEQGIGVTGVVGQRGAVYSTSLSCLGFYAISFKFKFPKNIQQGSGSVQLAKLNYLDSTAKGGFCIDLVSATPSANPPFSQPSYNAGFDFYAITSKTNNYGVRYRPDGKTNKQFVGKSAISVRYVGDISVEANRDVVLTISESGLTVKHSSNNSVLVSEAFPVSKSMNEWVATLLQKTASGGDYYGIIDVDFQLAEGYSTDDLLRVENIPLVGDYSTQSVTKGWQAFPCFLYYYDDSWHDVYIRVNFNKAAFRDAVVCLLDGQELTNPTSSPSLSGTGVFTADFTLGGEGILVKDFSFRNNPSKSDIQKIVVCMTHDQTDGVYDPNTTSGYITIGRMQWIIDKFEKHGFSFVGLDKIADYMNNNEKLPEKCYTIIFDDMYYFEDWGNAVSNKFRRLLMSRNAKASFAITPNAVNTDDKVNAIMKDKDSFLFHLHDNTTPTAEKFGYSDFMTHFQDLFLGIRNKIGSSNIYTYSGGNYDANLLPLFEQLGICYASYVLSPTIRLMRNDGTYREREVYTYTTKANSPLAQPRLAIDDDDLTEEKLETILSYLDSI